MKSPSPKLAPGGKVIPKEVQLIIQGNSYLIEDGSKSSKALILSKRFGKRNEERRRPLMEANLNNDMLRASNGANSFVGQNVFRSRVPRGYEIPCTADPEQELLAREQESQFRQAIAEVVKVRLKRDEKVQDIYLVVTSETIDIAWKDSKQIAELTGMSMKDVERAKARLRYHIRKLFVEISNVKVAKIVKGGRI